MRRAIGEGIDVRDRNGNMGRGRLPQRTVHGSEAALLLADTAHEYLAASELEAFDAKGREVGPPEVERSFGGDRRGEPLADDGRQWALRQADGSGQARVLMTIDGRSGAGKSHLAQQIRELLAGRGSTAEVVSLDDLYEGWSGPTGKRFAEQLRAWIRTPWVADAPMRHRLYDWDAGAYGGWCRVPQSDVLIVEGVGAGHPVLSEVAQLRVWIEAPMGLRYAAAATRPGPAVEQWWTDWQQVEEQYLHQYRPEQYADWIVEGDAPAG